ncbi:hypothetical protein PIB30_094166 [Stylosanthes scabra]|uniref:Uncharacterized protein n=1 Tax=Stylosanthes scabra TaxID=79078 RepID=A0ABU6VUL6_9FABA|nr:hypothetical protein [Stylosanthes scabra]
MDNYDTNLANVAENLYRSKVIREGGHFSRKHMRGTKLLIIVRLELKRAVSHSGCFIHLVPLPKPISQSPRYESRARIARGFTIANAVASLSSALGGPGIGSDGHDRIFCGPHAQMKIA